MIQAVLIFNTHGKPRLSKFYTPLPPLVQQSLIAQIFSYISDRPSGVCNFLDAPDLVFPSATSGSGKEKAGENDMDDIRVIYRHYATLYFVASAGLQATLCSSDGLSRQFVDYSFVVDGAESELGILDLIQVFVESLDRAFENVCELDLIFHFDQVHHVLGEIIQGGLVLETNINEISTCVRASSANRKASAASANPLVPSMLVAPGGRTGRGGTVANGARNWLSAIGV